MTRLANPRGDANLVPRPFQESLQPLIGAQAPPIPSQHTSKPRPLKALAEKFPRPVEAGFDRLHGHVEDRRDLVIRHSLVVVEDEDRAVLVIKAVQRSADLLLLLLGQEPLLQVDASIRKVGCVIDGQLHVRPGFLLRRSQSAQRFQVILYSHVENFESLRNPSSPR